MRRTVGRILLPTLGPSAFRALHRTWKPQFLGRENLEEVEAGKAFLIILWHGRMLIGMPYHAHRDWQVLVSPSDDGSLVKPMLHHFGYGVMRGSSSRGGSRAAREMLDQIRERERVVLITPDGPRGPRHSMNPGPAWLARETGSPILPIGLACDRAWHLQSWDHFTIPKPGAHLATVYGEPLRVEPDASDERLEEVTKELRARLIFAEADGFELLGREPDW